MNVLFVRLGSSWSSVICCHWSIMLYVYLLFVQSWLFIVESDTGVTEKFEQTINLYPHRLSFVIHNLPAVYKPGQSLNLPVSSLPPYMCTENIKFPKNLIIRRISPLSVRIYLFIVETWQRLIDPLRHIWCTYMYAIGQYPLKRYRVNLVLWYFSCWCFKLVSQPPIFTWEYYYTRHRVTVCTRPQGVWPPTEESLF